MALTRRHVTAASHRVSPCPKQRQLLTSDSLIVWDVTNHRDNLLRVVSFPFLLQPAFSICGNVSQIGQGRRRRYSIDLESYLMCSPDPPCQWKMPGKGFVGSTIHFGIFTHGLLVCFGSVGICFVGQDHSRQQRHIDLVASISLMASGSFLQCLQTGFQYLPETARDKHRWSVRKWSNVVGFVWQLATAFGEIADTWDCTTRWQASPSLLRLLVLPRSLARSMFPRQKQSCFFYFQSVSSLIYMIYNILARWSWVVGWINMLTASGVLLTDRFGGNVEKTWWEIRLHWGVLDDLKDVWRSAPPAAIGHSVCW